jgi:DNA (cytosine-5)-methyltransferase 1
MDDFTFLEFFCGGGMARAGLGARWRCLFANDFDPMKARVYADNWGGDHLLCADVAKITPARLPGTADLAWASFPCQDLSLAGDYAGLGRAGATAATRSGTFWPFWSLIKAMRNENRGPKLVVLENVPGVLTSNQGRDFAAIGRALSSEGYEFGAMVVDAVRFVPQSRPRVFIVAIDARLAKPASLLADGPSPEWHPKALVKAAAGLSGSDRKHWIWWRMPTPALQNVAFADLVEDQPVGVSWHSPAETARLLGMMTPLNLAKVESAKRARKRVVGAIYRRTRSDADGAKRQRAEVRFDDVAGCLRTPRGGSSRQTIIVVEGAAVRSRLLSPREAARLMGLPDSYVLPERYNDAYHLVGDGVVVPVVRHLAEHIFEPILTKRSVTVSPRRPEREVARVHA